MSSCILQGYEGPLRTYRFGFVGTSACYNQAANDVVGSCFSSRSCRSSPGSSYLERNKGRLPRLQRVPFSRLQPPSPVGGLGFHHGSRRNSKWTCGGSSELHNGRRFAPWSHCASYRAGCIRIFLVEFRTIGTNSPSELIRVWSRTPHGSWVSSIIGPSRGDFGRRRCTSSGCSSNGGERYSRGWSSTPSSRSRASTGPAERSGQERVWDCPGIPIGSMHFLVNLPPKSA